MKYSSSLDFDRLNPKETLIIVSPGNLEDMVNYPRFCKARGIDYIFDPGQSLPMLDAKDLIQAIEGCRILISNDYELDLIMSKTGLNKEALRRRARTIIVTLGELGSQVFTPDGEISISAVKPMRVEDPTGAGDSYRGGLISGLVRGKDIEAVRQDGQRVRFLCCRVLRHSGIQVQPRGVQREAQRVLQVGQKFTRLLKSAHLLRFPHPSSLRRTSKYASFLRISGALHLGIFEQPEE